MIKRRIAIALVPVALAGLGGAAWFGTRAAPSGKSAAPTQRYVFATIARGNIESVVTSSGTLQPVSEVSVLPQMSGRAIKVNADYNQKVKKGQVLVELDTTMLKLQEKEKEAAVTKARASYELQATTVRNNEKLAAKGLISDFDLASSRSVLAVDKAELESAEASLEYVRMQIETYAKVTAPIDGIVLARNVDEGENVVEGSSSNSSSLFTIAGDLSRMEIEAEVDELDIGSIRKGQEARFTVEALPGRTIAGVVREVRLVPTTSSNVVTYTVIVDAPNEDGRLLPGMTAEIEFIKEKKDDVLIVPNAALRFTPAGMSSQEVAKAVFLAGLGDLTAEQRKEAEARYDEARKKAAEAAGQAAGGRPSGLTGMMMGGPGGPPGGFGNRNRNGKAGGNGASGGASGGAQDAAARAARKPLWYVDAGGKLAVMMVQVGSTDGKNTEVWGEGLEEGAQVILRARVE